MNKRGRSGGVEDSQVSFYCHDNRNESISATCMKNGNWIPDPRTYKCQNNETREVTTSKENKIFPCVHNCDCLRMIQSLSDQYLTCNIMACSHSNNILITSHSQLQE